MNILVPVKQVPDLVEELEIGSGGTDLDREYLKYVMNEFDDHALEEALLVKEATGGTVTVITLDMADADQILFTAVAKGADTIIKVGGDYDESPPDTHTLAKIMAGVLSGRTFDAIFTGVQAADDIDGQLGPLLATAMGLPHVSVVSGVTAAAGSLTVHQEFGGGVMAELEVPTPCLIGIQAAGQAPRYAAISRVRQAMKETTIETVDAPAVDQTPLTIRSMVKPETGSRAEMLSGGDDAVADRIVSIIRERGLVKA